MIDFTDRDKSISLLVGATGWTLGIWQGVYIVPDAALAVPKRVENGETMIAYQPVPTWLPLVTVLVLLVAVYFAYVFARDDDGDRDNWGVTDD